MKIVHFCADLSPWNGMANTARQLVAEEMAQGHDSVLTNDLSIVHLHLQPSPSSSPARIHIHGTWLPVLWKAAKLAKRWGVEVVVHPHGNYDPLRRRQGAWKRLKKWAVGPWERAMLRRADAILATCEAEAGWIREYLGGIGVESRCRGRELKVERGKRKEGEIQIVDLKRFFKIGGGDDRFCGATTRKDSLHVLFLGRAEDPLKGVRYLERAVGENPTPGCNAIELRIVSDHTGAELEADWEWCDVLCLPTLSENFGLVVAEALERGKRVITTDGAPAWDPEVESSEGVKVDNCRLIYLRGFRDGDDARRVELLKGALMHASRGCSDCGGV